MGRPPTQTTRSSPARLTTTWPHRSMAPTKADTRTKRRRSFRIRKRRARHGAGLTFDQFAFGPLIFDGYVRPASSGNRGSYLAGESALVAGLIQRGHRVEVSAATGHQVIFIRWARNSGGDFHELRAGSRAPIHVVADNRDSRSDWGRFPTERNAVGLGFLTAREPEAKQGTYRQQEPQWVGSH